MAHSSVPEYVKHLGSLSISHQLWYHELRSSIDSFIWSIEMLSSWCRSFFHSSSCAKLFFSVSQSIQASGVVQCSFVVQWCAICTCSGRSVGIFLMPCRASSCQAHKCVSGQSPCLRDRWAHECISVNCPHICVVFIGIRKPMLNGLSMLSCFHCRASFLRIFHWSVVTCIRFKGIPCLNGLNNDSP